MKPLLSILFILMPFASSFSGGKRDFIGTSLKYFSEDAYKASPNAELVLYDNFNDNELSPAWQALGNLEFYEIGRNLTVPVVSRKRIPKSGSLTLRKPVDVRPQAVRIAVDQVIPSDDPNIASSLYFAPEECGFDAVGHPDAFVRFFKRSQLELIESKTKDGSAQLVWGRNDKVHSSEVSHYVFQINGKEAVLLVNDSLVFKGSHYVSPARVVAGLWVSTKGKNFTGGSMVFDNFVIEQVNEAPTVNEDEVLPVEMLPEEPAPSEASPPAAQ